MDTFHDAQDLCAQIDSLKAEVRKKDEKIKSLISKQVRVEKETKIVLKDIEAKLHQREVKLDTVEKKLARKEEEIIRLKGELRTLDRAYKSEQDEKWRLQGRMKYWERKTEEFKEVEKEKKVNSGRRKRSRRSRKGFGLKREG